MNSPNSLSRIRVRNDIANSEAAASNVPLVIEARVTQVTINAEIERAVVEYKHDEDLQKYLNSLDDKTSQTGKYAGDTWAAAFRVLSLVHNNSAYPGLNSVRAARVKKGLYGPVLRALGMHRIQRLTAYAAKVALEKSKAASEAANEDVDHSGE